MTHKRRTAALLACALLLLPACQSQAPAEHPQPEETPAQESEAPARKAEFALAYDATDTLDPLAGAGATNLTLSGLVYEGLFELDASFAPQKLLCDSYAANEDNTVWTFTLRAGVTFSDGTPLTAAHAAASLNAARASALYAARLTQVTAVTAGDGTVSVTLSAPNGALPALLDLPITLAGGDGSAAPLGTGPYYYAGGSGGFSLRANPHWWQDRALPLDSIPLRATSTADERIAAFDTGMVTVTTSDLTGTNALGYSGNYETWDCTSSALLYLGFNCEQGFCRDTALRQAVYRGVDRATVTASLLSGHANAALFPIHPDSACYDDNLAGELDYSVSAAAQLLEAGGYLLTDGALTRNGRAVELTLLVNTDNSFRVSVADYLAQELSKLGLRVSVVKLPWEEYLAALSRGEFDLYLAQVKLTADFDPTSLLTGGLNYGGFWSEGTNALLAAYRAGSGGVRQAAARALCADLASKVPFAPLCFLRTSVLTQWGAVSGLEPTTQNAFYHIYNWTVAQ